MIRPGVRAGLRRWGEALAGLGLLALGLRWTASTGLLVWVGAAVAALGAGVAFTGVQRARFRRGGEGPGVVRVDEGRVLYMGPSEGGAADLDALRSVSLDPEGPDGPAWVLDGDRALRVPADALGADALLDAFAALPGFEASRALAALGRRGSAPVAVWRAPGAAGEPARLPGAGAGGPRRLPPDAP